MQPENLERCRSGRTGQSRKLLNSLWVPGVRIPLFPQKGPGAISAGAFLRKEGDGRQIRPFFFYPLPNLPLGEGLVASLREGSGPVFRQSFLNLPAALPFSFHNGSRFRISLPLWNDFSAVSLQQALWTALPPQSPSTTTPIPAFPCRCGKNRRAHLPKVSLKRGETAHLPKVDEWRV